MQSESVTEAVLACERLASLAESITVELIMTPSSALYRGVTPESHIGEAPLGGVVPVCDPAGEIEGLLFYDEIKNMNPMQAVKGAYRTLNSLPPVSAGTGLRDTLEQLGDRVARLVVDGERVVGLVQRRDFNRRAARIHHYLWFSAVEAGLAQLLPSKPSDLDLAETLDEETAIGVLGTKALRTWKGGSADTTEYLQFPSLLRFARQDEFVLRLGFGSVYEWDDMTKGLSELHRKILDPRQILVTDAESVHSLLYADLRIRDIQVRLRKALKNSEN